MQARNKRETTRDHTSTMALKPLALKEDKLKKKKVQDFQCNERDQNNKTIQPESDEVSEGRAKTKLSIKGTHVRGPMWR